MKPVELLRAVFLGIAVNKFRVFLTSLGIIIGAFTIIMVVGIGKAGEDAVSEQFSRLSVESITIARTRGTGSAQTSTAVLSREDAVRMVDELDYVRSIGVSTRTTSDISAGMVSSSISILGIDENYAMYFV
ncbi:MAG: ABC transporter permease [Clostridiales bacterium]|nr:ABC transporter permease [Clostridiales bacterium]